MTILPLSNIYESSFNLKILFACDSFYFCFKKMLCPYNIPFFNISKRSTLSLTICLGLFLGMD